jgi:hypothetical protein
VPTFTVLCRIDAYADYVAEVEADSAKEAARLAAANQGDYKWEHSQTAEFDDRYYAALDDDGEQIEATRTGDDI